MVAREILVQAQEQANKVREDDRKAFEIAVHNGIARVLSRIMKR